MFNPGDEVVCINDDAPPQVPPNVVVKGRTYTVTGGRLGFVTVERSGPFVLQLPMLCLFLAEVPSERGFYAFRFRKVDKRVTDISVFKEIVEGKSDRYPISDPVAKPEKVQ